jgi:hypothetical protein
MPAFQAAMERGTDPEARNRLATFHRHGTIPGEYSDIFVRFEVCEQPVAGDLMHRVLESSDLFDQSGLEPLREKVTQIALDLAYCGSPTSV